MSDEPVFGGNRFEHVRFGDQEADPDLAYARDFLKRRKILRWILPNGEKIGYAGLSLLEVLAVSAASSAGPEQLLPIIRDVIRIFNLAVTPGHPCNGKRELKILEARFENNRSRIRRAVLGGWKRWHPNETVNDDKINKRVDELIVNALSQAKAGYERTMSLEVVGQFAALSDARSGAMQQPLWQLNSLTSALTAFVMAVSMRDTNRTDRKLKLSSWRRDRIIEIMQLVFKVLFPDQLFTPVQLAVPARKIANEAARGHLTPLDQAAQRKEIAFIRMILAPPTDETQFNI